MEFDQYLNDAIINQKSVTIEYIKYGGEYSIRRISNIQHSEEFGNGYISAFCHKRQENRTFKIDRIKSIDGILNSHRLNDNIRNSSHLNSHAGSNQIFSSYKSNNISTQQSSYRNNNSKKSEGCYIATMVYGDYNHPQVVILRNFRDTKLLPTYFGRLFVKFYYYFSPNLVKILGGHQKINKLIQKLLDNIIKFIE